MASRHKRNSSLPTTAKGLRAWLKGTDEGQAILRDAAAEFLQEKCRACQNMRPFPRVLIVLRRLGAHPGAEVYAEEGVTVRFMELPDVADDGCLGELVERLIAAKLPKSWLPMTELPAKRIKSEVFRGITAEKALGASRVAAVLKQLQELKQ